MNLAEGGNRAYGARAEANADLTTTEILYDQSGNRTNSTDQLGRSTSYVYDSLNRLNQTIFADRTTNMTVYDDLSRVKFSVDAHGITNAFGYDPAGRRTAVTNAWGTAVAMTNGFVFDLNGNQFATIDALGHSTTNVFDVLNRAVQVVYADGTKASRGYDGAGRHVAETNQDGIITFFGYDGAGRLTFVTNALGTGQQIVTQYQCDEAGNETAQIDALGHVTVFAYDTMDRRIKIVLAQGQTETMGYDLAGNLVRSTNFDGVVITNQYDALNRLTNRASIGDYRIAFGYDSAGNRTNMIDGSGSSGYTYNSRNRLTAKLVQWSGGPSISLNYEYDLNGNVTNIWSTNNVPSAGVNLQYSYDPLNRITNVIAEGAAAANYGFDANGNLQSVILGNGATNLFQYDILNRLTNSVWKSNQLTLANFYYQLGATGYRTNLAETLFTSATNRIYRWSYDALYRLTSEGISGIGTNTYGLDGLGNRTNRSAGLIGAQSFAYGSNDWVTTDAYDSNGSTLWTTNAGSATGPYNFDPENRLTNFNNTVYCGYNGDGIRVSKTAQGTNFFYLVDNRNPSGYAQVLEEWTSSNGATNLSRVYNFGLSLISQKYGSTVHYLLPDGHGSTRLLMDGAGVVQNAFAFDGYGGLIASNGSPVTVYLYCGEQFDPDLGFYYLRSRYFNPNTGRFWTMDDFLGGHQDPLALHKYLYCQNDPITLRDPSGASPEVEELAASLIQAILFSLNAVGAVHNGILTVEYTQAAISYAHGGDAEDALMASGAAVIHGSFAILNILGARAAWRPPPPPSLGAVAASTGGGVGGVWRMSANPAFGRWVWGALWPAIGPSIVMMSDQGHHELEWQHRGKNGQIQEKGDETSGSDVPPGRRLTWPEQLMTHTEYKVLVSIADRLKRGDIISMQGELPPCYGCRDAMEHAARDLHIKIVYRIQGTTEVYRFGY